MQEIKHLMHVVKIAVHVTISKGIVSMADVKQTNYCSYAQPAQ